MIHCERDSQEQMSQGRTYLVRQHLVNDSADAEHVRRVRVRAAAAGLRGNVPKRPAVAVRDVPSVLFTRVDGPAGGEAPLVADGPRLLLGG